MNERKAYQNVHSSNLYVSKCIQLFRNNRTILETVRISLRQLTLKHYNVGKHVPQTNYSMCRSVWTRWILAWLWLKGCKACYRVRKDASIWIAPLWESLQVKYDSGGWCSRQQAGIRGGRRMVWRWVEGLWRSADEAHRLLIKFLDISWYHYWSSGDHSSECRSSRAVSRWWPCWARFDGAFTGLVIASMKTRGTRHWGMNYCLRFFGDTCDGYLGHFSEI